LGTVRPVELAPDATLAQHSRAERAKLRRELSRLDTIFFLISAMVVVDTIGAIAIGGGQAFTWLVVLFVFFFIPSALASCRPAAPSGRSACWPSSPPASRSTAPATASTASPSGT
jgi:hypothetical protein